MWCTPGTYTDYIRQNVMPFSLVRWQAMQMYLADLFVAVMGWSIVGEVVGAQVAGVGSALRIRLDRVNVLRGILVVGVITSLALSPPTGWNDFGLGQVDYFGATPLVWTAISVISLVVAGLFTYLLNRGPRIAIDAFPVGVTIANGSVAVTFIALLYSFIYSANPPDWWHAMIVLPKGSGAFLDIGHLIIFSIVVFAVIRVAKNRIWLLNALIAIGVTDVSMASLRYYGETEMVNVEYVRDRTAVPRVTGNRRFGADNGAGLIALASTAPHMWAYPGAMPDVARVDHEWGDPSVFQQFATFPASWTVLQGSGSADETRAVAVTRQSMNGQADAGALQPSCASGESFNSPTVTIERFLSTIIDVIVESSCSRLLVWTDTWAEGWTATLNGAPTEVYRVNSTVRGVIIGVGKNHLAWRYAPPSLGWSLGVMIGALTTSMALILWGSFADSFFLKRMLGTKVSDEGF